MRQRVSNGRPATSLCEDWRLTPEGGAVHPGERVAVIADVHLGYEWARGAAGDCVPAHSLAETVKKLERLLERSPIDRLVVAGDLVETPRPCANRRRPCSAGVLAPRARRSARADRGEPRSQPGLDGDVKRL